MSFIAFLFKLPGLACKIEKICNWVLAEIEVDKQKKFLQKLKGGTDSARKDKDTSKLDNLF